MDVIGDTWPILQEPSNLNFLVIDSGKRWSLEHTTHLQRNSPLASVPLLCFGTTLLTFACPSTTLCVCTAYIHASRVSACGTGWLTVCIMQRSSHGVRLCAIYLTFTGMQVPPAFKHHEEPLRHSLVVVYAAAYCTSRTSADSR